MQLAFRREGEGEPVLFLPPLGGTHAAFNHLRRRLPPCQAILFDPRGSGASDRPASGYSVQQAAADGWALLDGLGIGQAVLVGVSFGGAVAQAMAGTHPDRMDGLLLISTWLAPDAHRSELVRVWAELYERLPVGLFYREVHLWTFAPALYERSEATIRRLQQGLALERGHPDRAVFRQMAEAALAFDGRGLLAGLRVPARVLVGGEDRVTPPKEAGRLAAQVPGAELRVVPGRGHGLVWEDPDEPLQALAEVLNAVEVSGR
ncbi:alpha/beta fold hydrolase [Limnochorda pilosa]|uniref:alpha/beta fold hydrolase n=1 Tax=Limnochorda pilosa TaxID=1555112 RepID=UPI00130E1991|nr:alpha/beta fold hydrolase [Limnochorda pilosa]